MHYFDVQKGHTYYLVDYLACLIGMDILYPIQYTLSTN